MQGVEGQVLYDMEINGVPYPLQEDFRSIVLYDNLNQTMPTMSMTLFDTANILTELCPFTGRETFDLKFGPSIEQVQSHSFLYDTGGVVGRVVEHEHTMSLVSKNAYDLYSERKFSSYPNMKISDIVSEIVQSAGANPIVEPTIGVGNYFCPGWTHSSYLKWLASNATQKDGYGGYMCHWKLNNDFIFYPKEYSMKASRGSRTTLRTNPQEDDNIAIKGYALSVYTGKAIRELVGGATTYQFNFTNSDFESVGVSKIEEMSRKRIAGKISLYPDESTGRSRIDAGVPIYSDTRSSVVEANHEIERLADSMFRMEVLIDGTFDISPGDIVSVYIPSLYPDGKVNSLLSGDWLVEGIALQIIPAFQMKLLLTREGIDDSGSKGIL